MLIKIKLTFVILFFTITLHSQAVKNNTNHTTIYSNDGLYFTIIGDTAYYEIYVFDKTKYFLTLDTLVKQKNEIYLGKIVFAKQNNFNVILKNNSGEKFIRRYKPTQIVMSQLNENKISEYYIKKSISYGYLNSSKIIEDINAVRDKFKRDSLSQELHRIINIPWNPQKYYDIINIVDENSYQKYINMIIDFKRKVELTIKK